MLKGKLMTSGLDVLCCYPSAHALSADAKLRRRHALLLSPRAQSMHCCCCGQDRLQCTLQHRRKLLLYSLYPAATFATT